MPIHFDYLSPKESFMQHQPMSLRLLIACCVALLANVTDVAAQGAATTAPCPQDAPLPERVTCLQAQLTEVLQTIELYRDRAAVDDSTLRKSYEDGLKFGLYGPQKKVTPLSDIMVSTDMYWKGKRYLGATNLCYPKPKAISRGTAWDKHLKAAAPDGMVLFVVDYKSDNSKGCKKSGTCDSHGEKCVTHYLKSGCYVTEEWLTWYEERLAALNQPIDKTFVCSTQGPIRAKLRAK